MAAPSHPATAASPSVRFEHCVALHSQGRRAEAEHACRELLQRWPDHVDAWHLLGIIALQAGRLDGAVECFGRAITLNPAGPAGYSNRAIPLDRLGRPEEALHDLDRSIALQPGRAQVHYKRGDLLRRLGRPEQALAALERALVLEPGFADAHVYRGILLRGAGRLDEAVDCFDRAIALQPDNVTAHVDRGNTLLDLGRGEAAMASYDRAIALRPNEAPAHVGRGNALLRQDRIEAALVCFDQAIMLAPAYAEAYRERGNVLAHMDQSVAALASYDKAIALQPDDPGAYLNRGDLLRHQDRVNEAVACLEAAVAVRPLNGASRIAACLAQLPVMYHAAAEMPLRRQSYMRALERLAAAAEDPAIQASLASAIGPLPYHLSCQGGIDVLPQARFGGLMCRILADTMPAAPLAAPPSPGSRIRLGIVSGFFRGHTVFKLFLEGWLTELDRERFEIIGFHTSPTSDPLTAWSAGHCDRFVQGLPSKAAWRQAISDAAPHVLLYPEVGMDMIVGWLAPQRLAPVQCVAWGHPETTGMPTIDYFLSSDFMEPPDAATHYTEPLVRLPHLGTHFTPTDVALPTIDRAELGLDATVPLYWSGQALYKYLPQHDWMFPRIAAAVGDCRFVFVSVFNDALTAVFRQRLAQAFAAAGMDAERYCRILPAMPHDRFVAIAGLADVILDPPGWSGGKSTLDCLQQNPAIVTLPGPLMRSRHTAAILRRIGCEATVAGSLDTYVAIAARLGRDADWRRQIRQDVAERKHHAFRDRDCIAALETFLTSAITG